MSDTVQAAVEALRVSSTIVETEVGAQNRPHHAKVIGMASRCAIQETPNPAWQKIAIASSLGRVTR